MYTYDATISEFEPLTESQGRLDLIHFQYVLDTNLKFTFKFPRTCLGRIKNLKYAMYLNLLAMFMLLIIFIAFILCIRRINGYARILL